MYRKITLDDLARELSLSKFSVSRALSGKGGVSAATRSRVLEAARAMGYGGGPARALPAGEQNIQLLIPSADAMRSAFWIEVIAAAEAEARRLGYRLSTQLIGAESAPAEPPVGVAGLLLAGRRARGLLESYIALPIPKVLIGHPRPMEIIDSVQAANFDCGFGLGSLLGKFGHRTLGYVSDVPDDEGRNLRFAGLAEAMRRFGGKVHTHIMDESREPAQTVLEVLRDPRAPTALVCASDGVAMTVSWGLINLGLEVPNDISVVGASDVHAVSSLGMKLTTTRQPVVEIGSVAVQMLDWRMHVAAEGARPRRTLITPELVERASHGPFQPDRLAAALARIG